MNKIKSCPSGMTAKTTHVGCLKQSIVSSLPQNSVSKNQYGYNSLQYIHQDYISDVKKYISNISIVKDILKDTIGLIFFIFCVFVIRLSINVLIPIQNPLIEEICIILDESCIVLLQFGLLLLIIKHSVLRPVFGLIKEFKKIQKI